MKILTVVIIALTLASCGPTNCFDNLTYDVPPAPDVDLTSL